MKRICPKIKNKELINYILILIAATIAAIPLINLRIYGTHDGFIHILRTMGVENIIKTGIFPPFIDTTYCNNFGYAINVFYPPIVTYLPVLINFILKNVSNTLKIYTYLTIILSGFTMYKLVKEISNKKEIALFSAIIYIFIPYRLETIYTRFAIGEFSAYIFIPLVFLGLHNLLYGDKKKHYYISIGAIGLILTHTLSTEFTAIFSLIYILLNFYKIKNKEVLKKIAINIIFTVTITSFFWIPLLEYRLHSNYSIFSSDIMGYTGENVSKNTIGLIQLIKDTNSDSISFSLGIGFLVFILLGIITYRKMENKDKSNYLSFLLIAIISLFMATRYLPWRIMPDFISTMQFAWRMLMFFEFACAILCGYNLYTLINTLNKNNSRNIQKVLVIFTSILIVVTMSKVNYNYRYEEFKKDNDNDYEKWIQSQEKISPYKINREYLPQKSDNNINKYIETRDYNIHVISGKTTILEQNKNKLNFKAKLTDVEKETKLELPFINYPGYKIELENDNYKKVIKYEESEYGFIKITIPEDMENVNVKVQYIGTTLEKTSYIISIIGVIGFIIYLLNKKRKNKIEIK